MSYDLSIALKCFQENFQLFGDPKAAPEKFNLYNGLVNLTDGIMQMEQEIRGLREETQQIYKLIKRKSEGH